MHSLKIIGTFFYHLFKLTGKIAKDNRSSRSTSIKDSQIIITGNQSTTDVTLPLRRI